jgi:hypothetical protein
LNEYTRREEVRWILIASATLVVCIAAAVALLVTAQGKLIPDPEALAMAKATAERSAAYASLKCNRDAKTLADELPLFKKAAEQARVVDDKDKGTKGKKPSAKKDEKKPDVQLAWATAQPAYRAAKALARCREATEQAAGVRPDAARAWDAVRDANALVPPADNDNAAQIDAARKLLGLLGDAPVDKLVQSTKDAEVALKTAADDSDKKAAVERTSPTKREPLPKGLLARELAISLGVGLSLIALLISFLSVRATSVRRLVTLLPLRDAAKNGMPGLQAAALLRLAGQPNGGEPGLVIGAAVGGLVTAASFRLDADLFVAGVMAGLLLGLGAQVALRAGGNSAKWRARATELGEIEKPAIPIVLILSGVNPGLEDQFLGFFSGLAPADAAATVQKLATQAEDRILAAAEAGAAANALAQQQAQAPGFAPPQAPGWGAAPAAPGFGQQAPQQPAGYAPPPGYPPGGYPPGYGGPQGGGQGR